MWRIVERILRYYIPIIDYFIKDIIKWFLFALYYIKYFC